MTTWIVPSATNYAAGAAIVVIRKRTAHAVHSVVTSSAHAEQDSQGAAINVTVNIRARAGGGYRKHLVTPFVIFLDTLWCFACDFLRPLWKFLDPF